VIFFSLQKETRIIWFGHRKKNQNFHSLNLIIGFSREVLVFILDPSCVIQMFITNCKQI